MSQDPLRYFRIEARELVDQISAGVLDLDQHPGPELVARLLRFAHTLKGAARVVRRPEIADRAHAFEEVLMAHRGDGARPTAGEIRELLRLTDEIDARVTAMGGGPSTAPADGPPSTGATHPPTGGPGATGPGATGPGATGPGATGPGGSGAASDGGGPPIDMAPVGRSSGADVDDLLDAVGEAHARFAPLRSAAGSLAGLHRAAESLAGRLRGSARRAGDPDPPQVRAAAVRLADDLNSLGRRLGDAVEQVERELDEVRGRAERLRLVAASSVFTGLRRAARDAADAEGKRVHFDGHGGELRMDPQVLMQAGTALQHVVRNAVAHGIEVPADRLTAGKPAEGRVVVSVARRGRYAAFRCADDGRGFDLDELRRTARRRGLPVSDAELSDERGLLDLVLRGGISTTATVTEVSGRGIGLDVVRDVAEQLGGTVSVRTTRGAGAAVELVVPLSLLSLHGLVVEAGPTVATVPLDSVRTCVRLPAPQAASADADGRLAHDGRAVPYLTLRRALGVADDPTAGAPGDARVAVLVAADGDVVAIGVDRLAGTSTLVVRPLPELAPAVPVIGGVSIDLDGNPRLVLDAHGLVAAASRYRGRPTDTVTTPATRLPILVVDDSLTTRMLERSILESAGYEVDLAASGEEGLEKARLRPYALYLTDVDMPGIDGFTFIERARADPASPDVPAILVSSRASTEDRTRGAAVGAAAYVVKGEFDQEELLAHIRRLVPT